jgi:hypothetical protein
MKGYLPEIQVKNKGKLTLILLVFFARRYAMMIITIITTKG